jgi:ATP-binding cassette subfamily F protein uup
MHNPIFFLKEASLFFTKKVIFNNLELYLHNGDKACLMGANGSGKSTLFKVINKTQALDSGKMYQAPTASIAYLKQESNIMSDKTATEWLEYGISSDKEANNVKVFLEQLKIPTNIKINCFSGGQKKRLALAETLIKEAQILLLDEPTNHLDIEAIKWLENYLSSYKGAIICISHDKKFLENISTKIFWLHQTQLYNTNANFKHFLSWQEEILTNQQKELEKLKKKLVQENLWLMQGISARRKRNQLRLSNLYTLKEQVKQNEKKESRLIIQQNDKIKKSKFILEAESLGYYTEGKPLFENFNLRVIKGEKIGIIGANGCGKSSLLQILIKQIPPDTGSVKHTQELKIAYFSQNRDEINKEKTILQNLCPEGADHVIFNNRKMHAAGYLKKFLFDPKVINDKANILSGGQINRLLLAKILLQESNLLILDEPTNDLDIESSEILLDFLQDYQGTIILVSHDRDFLENLITRSIIIKGNKIYNINGGYIDYDKVESVERQQKASCVTPSSRPQIQSNKISYKEKYEFETLPNTISKIELELQQLQDRLNDKDLFFTDKITFNKTIEEISIKEAEIENLMVKLLQLEEKIFKSENN